MRKSISYLPKYAQDDLKDIRQRILNGLPHCEMIILFGSYAKGNFVPFDERKEYGIVTSFMSDYDIFVITSHQDLREAGRTLDEIDQQYYRRHENQVPIQFINEDIKKYCDDLKMGRYFYTEIRRDGIELYNSKKYILPRCKNLDFSEIASEAERYRKEKMKQADSFLYLAECAYEQKNYKMASFQMHQAAENYFYAVRLVYTLKNSKQHNLYKLWSSTRGYSHELLSLFNFRDAEEKRLFELLKNAYVEARYNPDFLVTRKDCDYLFPKLKSLQSITISTCEAKLSEYCTEYDNNPEKRG